MFFVTAEQFMRSEPSTQQVTPEVLKRLTKKGAQGWADGVLAEDAQGLLPRWVIQGGCMRHIESDVAQAVLRMWSAQRPSEAEPVRPPPPEREAAWEREHRLGQEVLELVEAKKRALALRHDQLADEEFEREWLEVLRYDPPIKGDNGLWRNTKTIKVLEEAAQHGAARWDTSPACVGQVRLWSPSNAQTRAGWSIPAAVVRVVGEAPPPEGWRWHHPTGGWLWVERLSSHVPPLWPADRGVLHRVEASELIAQRWGEPGVGSSIVRRGLDALMDAEVARREPGPTPGHRE